MRRQIVGVCGLLICMLLIIACSGSSPDTLAQTNFKQGSAGVELRFLENAPPEILYPRSDFRLVLEAHNGAAYDVKNGELKIVGLNRDYFAVEPLEQFVGVLSGRSLMDPEGGREFIEFSGKAGDLFLNAEERVEPFLLKFHYNSHFEFSDTICINSQLYDVYDAGCQVEASKSYGGQGSPVSVCSMEEIVLPGGNPAVELRLHIDNMGSGEIGRVTLGKANFGGEEVACHFQEAEDISNFKTVEFGAKRQSATFVCTKYLTNSKTYSTTVSMDFTYDYKMQEEGQLRL